MHDHIDRVLIPHERIAARVKELADQIVAAQRQADEITIVPILTGAMIFCGDLIRQMPVFTRISLLGVSSYPGRSVRSQGAALLHEQLGNLGGRHILLVDDILDSGGTMSMVVPLVRSLGPASVKTCVLLRKDRPSARGFPVDYVGFEIPDVFVVGYGLDYDDYYRNLPDIVTLKQHVLGK